MGSVKKGVYIVDAGADHHVENHIPISCSGTLSSCRPSGVSHIGSFAQHCSVISQTVQRLGAPFAWSATPLSFTWWHGCPRLMMASLIVSFIVCTSFRVIVVAVSSDLSGWRELGTRHIAPQLTCGGDHRQTPCSKKKKTLKKITNKTREGHSF